MKRYNLLNTIFGWVAFAIAAVTYLLTMEPTASFWDCGEFISTAYKLDVGHPPGAPFFMLTGKFFSLFASDPSHVAVMINAMSAILSALTILFLFWTITHLARKIIIKDDSDYSTGNIIAILGAGMVGALAYTFSDTFWFSAVEGEVYAYSSFFTAIVFWLILRWENAADKEGSDRWLILIAYLMGLSIGVHLLNLLTIPAIVLVYYFKKYKPSAKGLIWALLASVGILAAVLYGLIPGFVEVGSWFELLFVNTLGLPFNSGLIFYIILTIGILVWGIYETYTAKSYTRMAISFVLGISMIGIPFIRTNIWLGIIIILAMCIFFYVKKNKISSRWLNTTLVMASVMLIGYSSYTIIMVRSAANPPMDQNSPENVFALQSYLNREQYGDTPLLYGAVYNAPVEFESNGRYCVPVEKKGKANYAPKIKESADEKDQYIITHHTINYEYNDDFKMLFPRMHSSQDPRHIEEYKSWGKIKGKKVSYNICGQRQTETKPTFTENMRFFFKYQLGFMYWRYFMWNFSGRQNDIQGQGEIEHGNWITGIKFIDNYLVGDQDTLPTELKENKGHNKYYMLPLLLGILGIIFQLNNGKEGKHGFWTVLFLFILTGIAIVVYLNQSPLQVRERDYAYAGSFYAFSVWIGLGVLFISSLLKKYIPNSVSAIIATVLCLGVPTLMAAENWDDHDRSGRYMARDFGANYLKSCKPNAIIFTNGDNDTFPLWYNQEVEGVGTDIRVCNLSYLQTDWYIDQMRRQAYESDPLPITWAQKDYMADKNYMVEVNDRIKQPLDVRTVYKEFLFSDNPNTKVDGRSYIPTKQIYIPIDKEQVLKTGTISPEKADEIVPRITIDLKRHLTKSEMMVIEMLRENNWERPIYFATTVGDNYYLGLNNNHHFEMTGLAYQVLPIDSPTGVNTDEMYDNMMNKFKYGNVNAPKIYIDENAMRMCKTHRISFIYLIDALLIEGDSVRAKKALEYADEMLPGNNVPHNDYYSYKLAEFSYVLKDYERGDKIINNFMANELEYLNWYLSMPPNQLRSSVGQIERRMSMLSYALRTLKDENRTELFDQYYSSYESILQKVSFLQQ